MGDDRMSSNDSDPFFMRMSFNVPHSPVLAVDDAHLQYFSHIQNADRREYLAALWRMDYKVGELISKLKETGEYDNTIFVYTSDNGPTGEGSAWPLRGAKGGSAEGGVRVPSFVSGPNIKPGVLDRMNCPQPSDGGVHAPCQVVQAHAQLQARISPGPPPA